jgi:hypothetical protein
MAKGKGYDLDAARAKPRRDESDRVYGRTAKPFSQQNVGGKVLGGPPNRDAQVHNAKVQSARSANQTSGREDSLAASAARRDAINKSDKMNREALNQMRAGARERKAATIRAKRPK